MPDTVPYQAYKSKKHSHTPSYSNSQFSPNISPPPLGSPSYLPISSGMEKDSAAFCAFPSGNKSPTAQALEDSKPKCSGILTPPEDSHEHTSSTSSSSPSKGTTNLSPETELTTVSRSSSPVASTSKPSHDKSQPAPHHTKRASTFRHVPLRNVRTSITSSTLSPEHRIPAHSRNVSVSSIGKSSVLDTNSSPQSIRPAYIRNQPGVPYVDPVKPFPDPRASIPTTRYQLASPSADVAADVPVAQLASRVSSNAVHRTTTSTSSSSSIQHRISAPYHPGFQPKGVYRLLTDDFVALRQAKQEGDGDRTGHGMKRAEKRKLERRLEKLIAIHFPLPSTQTNGVVVKGGEKPGSAVGRSENQRVSSFVDFDIRSITIQDAGGLWKGIFGSDEATTIRAAEQRITPWQDDAQINRCPLCSTSFHPLTNRKHHCRLCGQIICSLSPKLPQRPTTCSLLFVVDANSRKIEEVGERVDYGVKRRRAESNDVRMPKRKVQDHAEDDKFLRGIRICRTCRPVLLHQLHQHDTTHVPTFVRLYEAFLSLEHEIEEYVPQFQELILNLSHNNQPTKEASAMRRRLVEAFTQYDVLAKRIRKLPCPNGQGSSQDRVQVAVMTRANLFLQMNMVPLQSLSAPARNTTAPKNSTSTDDAASDVGELIDADSKAALALQPLLEQEALLESFVEEAQAHRKFEDMKTLKSNLGEIRAEIEKIFANTRGGVN